MEEKPGKLTWKPFTVLLLLPHQFRFEVYLLLRKSGKKSGSFAVEELREFFLETCCPYKAFVLIVSLFTVPDLMQELMAAGFQSGVGFCISNVCKLWGKLCCPSRLWQRSAQLPGVQLLCQSALEMTCQKQDCHIWMWSVSPVWL